jgi:hypothetical protein
MRALIPILLPGLALLAACSGGPAPDGDIATYDVLKAARADCEAKGNELVLVKEGNPERLSAYQCVRKPAK